MSGVWRLPSIYLQNAKGPPCVSRFGSETIAYAQRLATVSHGFGELPLSRAGPLYRDWPIYRMSGIWRLPSIYLQNAKGPPCVSRFGSETIAYAQRLATVSHGFGELPLSRAGPLYRDWPIYRMSGIWRLPSIYLQNAKGHPCVSRFGSETIAYAQRLASVSHGFGEIPLSRARTQRWI